MMMTQRRAIWSGACILAALASAYVAFRIGTPIASLALLLLTAAFWMHAQSIVSARDASVAALLARVGAYFSLLSAYTLTVAVIVGVPLHWLRDRGSLGAALAVSGGVMIALLGLWRLWPTFGLVSHDAGKRRIAPGPGLISRSFTQAWRLTAHNELFFGRGLLVALSLLFLAQTTLSLAGVAAPLAPTLRLPVLVIYALFLVPLANWIIVWCCKNAILLAYRRGHAGLSAPALPAPEIAAPSTNVQMPEGLSPQQLDAMLLRCARAGQIQLALGALAHGASVHCAPSPDDRDQRGVLVLAAVNPDLRLLRGLIAKGADLNRADGGLTPLIAATRDSHAGRPEAVMTLLTNGARPDCVDAQGNTPLHFAALAAQPVVAALLCDADAAINPVNRDGLTPLGVACAAANWNLAEFLLDHGAKLELEHVQPALLAASSIAEDDSRGVALLLKRRAHVNARGALGRSALMTGALHEHAAIVQTLIDAGADVNLFDDRGATALMEAARAGTPGVLDILARAGAALDCVDKTGRSALIIASQSVRASEETVACLLALGASTQVTLDDGRRAVDFAAAAGRWNIVALLDSTYPCPATLSATMLSSQPDPEHLLDALRFAHWQIADSYSGQVRAWPQAECVRMFVALIGQTEPAAWRWLFRHGLDANALAEDGRALLEHTLAQLPDTLPAAHDVVAVGAQIGGCGILAQVCAALYMSDDCTQRKRLERFAIELIERGADLFAPDSHGRTPLMQAVRSGSVGLTRELVNRGVDVQARDDNGRTALFAAVAHPPQQAIELIRVLLRAGANPESAARNGETALGMALARPAQDVRDWLNWPAWKLPQRRLRDADLVAAAASGDRFAVDKLLQLGLALNAADEHGASALIRAAGNGHVDLVAQLIERGADANATASTGATALSAAVTARQVDVVETLITHGVAVDQRLAGDVTVLLIAAGLGYPEIVAQLLAHAADVNAADVRGTRALHAAAQFGFAGRDFESAKRSMQALLDAGAEVDASNRVGQTAMLLLLGGGADVGAHVDQDNVLELLKALLALNANTQLCDQRGVSTLHACAMHGLLRPARALLATGADPTCCDERGRTPREVAHLLGFIDIAAELGANAPIAVPPQSARAPVFGAK